MLSLTQLEPCCLKEPDLFSGMDRLQPVQFWNTGRHNYTYDILRGIIKSRKTPPKYFPFMQLPREIRDQIYLYALQAKDRDAPQHSTWRLNSSYRQTTKPHTPGLIRLNKQIYSETIQVLYQTNVFKFRRPRQLFNFEDQIGASNQSLVRHIQIHIIPPDIEWDPMEVIGMDETPSHWARALLKSSLNKVAEMTVESEDVDTISWVVRPMTMALQGAIKNMMLRNKENPFPPRLTLRGFWESDHKEFPQSWKVVTEQWPPGDCTE